MKTNCYICGKPIIKARVEALRELNIEERRMTCIKHSETKPIKAIYSGENGTSPLIFCDKVYNDSVRSVFRSAEESIIEDPEVEE